MKTIIVIDIGGTNIVIGKMNNEKIVERIWMPTDPLRPENEIIEDILNGISKVISNDVIGIGVGVPGLVDETKGIIYNLNNIPSWKEVHLKKKIESYFKIPVYLSNDANCFALGEKTFGKGSKYNNLVGLTLGTGLGAGIIFDNNLYSGTLYLAGEIGGVPYKDQDYEYYCSSKFFESFYNMPSKQVYENALAGDPEAINIFREYGIHLGALIKTVLMIYAPEIIVLGGSIAKAYGYFEKSMIETVSKFPHKRVLDHLTIQASTNEDIALMGAAVLVLRNNNLK